MLDRGRNFERDIAVRKRTWENERFPNDVTGTVVDRDPSWFRVHIGVGADVTSITMVENLDVLTTARESSQKE